MKLTPIPSSQHIQVRFSVTTGLVRPGQTVHVVGDLPHLGEWDHNKSVPLAYAGENTFFTDVGIPALVNNFPFEFKVKKLVNRSSHQENIVPY